MKRISVFVLWVLLSTVYPVYAHSVNIFCYSEEGSIHGEGYFSGGRPAQHASVKIYSCEDNELLGETVTDERGMFTYPLTVKEPVKIVLYAGQGHRAEYIMQPEQNRAEQGSDNQASQRAEERRRSHPTIASIGGGIGIIIGIFGIIYIVKRRRRRGDAS